MGGRRRQPNGWETFQIQFSGRARVDSTNKTTTGVEWHNKSSRFMLIKRIDSAAAHIGESLSIHCWVARPLYAASRCIMCLEVHPRALASIWFIRENVFSCLSLLMSMINWIYLSERTDRQRCRWAPASSPPSARVILIYQTSRHNEPLKKIDRELGYIAHMHVDCDCNLSAFSNP